jgi:hypothetical protein
VYRVLRGCADSVDGALMDGLSSDSLGLGGTRSAVARWSRTRSTSARVLDLRRRPGLRPRESLQCRCIRHRRKNRPWRSSRMVRIVNGRQGVHTLTYEPGQPPSAVAISIGAFMWNASTIYRRPRQPLHKMRAMLSMGIGIKCQMYIYIGRL